MRSTTFLPWIVAFKAFKAVTLTALGVTLLRTRNLDPNDLLMRFALAVHLPLTSRVFARALVFANGLTTRKQTALALTAFGFAALMGTEGVALYLRKPWARWLTVRWLKSEAERRRDEGAEGPGDWATGRLGD